MSLQPSVLAALANWTARTLLTAAFAWAVCAAIGLPPAGDLVTLVHAAAVLIGAAILLLPLAASSRRTAPALVLAALLGGGTALAAPFNGMAVGPDLRVGACIGLMLYLIGALTRLLAPRPDRVAMTTAWILFFLAWLSASPVWLAPAVEWLRPGTPVVNTLVAVNPITHLGVAADLDWLRTGWLYRQSPLGSLRYDYPGVQWIVVAYFAAGLLATLAWPKRRSGPRNEPSAASTAKTSAPPARQPPSTGD
jgi:hypothetical protein